MKLPQPGRKLQLGASAGIALLAGAAILVLLNYLSASRYYKRWDWTSARLYTLSDKTKQILGEVAKRNQEVSVTVLIPQGSDLTDTVRELLSNYQAACPSIKVEYLDPARDLVRAETLTKEFGLQSSDEWRIVVFRSGRRSKEVDISELVEYDFSSPMGGPQRVKSFKGEQAFTGAVLSVTQESQSAVYFTKGHGETGPEDASRRGFSAVTDILKRQNYRVAAWDSLSGAAFPPDCSVLIIADPRSGFVESEVAAIRAYLKRGGRVLALLDPEFGRDRSIVQTGLEGLFREYGVDLGSDLVVDRGPSGVVVLGAGPETLIVSDLPDHPVTHNLAARYVILPVARSVTALSPAPAGVTTEPIARTSAEGWAERDLSSLETGISKGSGDLAGPVTVAVAVETRGGGGTIKQEGAMPAASLSGAPGGEGDGSTSLVQGTESVAGSQTRMIVFGDSDFATNGAISEAGNIDLALNAVSWLAEREALIGIEPRTPEQIVLSLTREQVRNMVLLVMLGLPGAAALTGLAVWWTRRS